MSEFEMKGYKELEKLLSNFPQKVEKQMLVKALRAGAKPIIKRARQLVPKLSGTLAKSIGTQTVRRSRGGQLRILARKGKKQKYDGWYAHLVEFGTKYTPAKPFFRPALDEVGDQSIKITGEKIAQLIEKEFRK